MWIAAEEPTSADWLSAWGQVGGAVATSIAVIIALWLGFRDRRWRRADQAAADAERRDAEAAQARLITVSSQWSDEDNESVVMTIANQSAAPFFDVRVLDLTAGAGDEDVTWSYHPSWSDELDTPAPQVLSVGETLRLVAIYRDVDRKQVRPFTDDHVTVRFTDAAGLRWTRRDTDPPQRLLDDPRPTNTH